MKAPSRSPARAAPGRAGWLVAGLAGSGALHAAALAALVLWPPAHLEDAGESGGVALVFADTGELADGAAAPGAPEPTSQAEPAAPAPEPAQAALPPLPDPPADPAPAPEPALAAAPPPPPVDAPAPPEPMPLLEAGILPPPPAPEPPSTTPPDTPPPAAEAQPPAPTPPVRAASRQAPPPRPAPPRQEAARGAPVRLDAGAGALGDPSLGARAMGAVVPPGADAGYRNAPPDYPAESRRRGEEGVVRLSLRVGPDGHVIQADILDSSGFPALDRAAMEAARRWRFRPATQGGLPVAATLSTAVHFRLSDLRGR